MSVLLERSLELDRPIVEALIGRPLRAAEQAIDVLRLDAALERAKADLEAAIRDEMLRATAAWVAGAAIAPALRVTPEMVAVLDLLTELGRQEAELELERLGYSGIRRRSFAINQAPVGRDVDGYLRQELGGIQVRIQDELVHADLGGQSQRAIHQALLRVPGARDVASRVISTAMIDGFAQTFDENEGLVRCWEYTAILDGGTCNACRPLDGRRFQSLEELFRVLPGFGPNPHCKGGGRCRCRAVPCPADEAGQGTPIADGPAPEDLQPDAPAWIRELAEIRKLESLRSLDDFGTFGAARRSAEQLRDANLIDYREVVAGRFEYVPTEHLAGVESAILRAGDLVEEQIQLRVSSLAAEVAPRQAILEGELEAAKLNYEAATTAVREARLARKAALDALTAEIRTELIEQKGLSLYDAFSQARLDPRFKAMNRAHELEAIPLSEKLTDASIALGDLRKEERAIAEAAQVAYRDAVLEALEEAGVEMGPGAGPAWKYSTGGVKGKAKEVLEKAAELYPRAWIERGRLNEIKPRFTARGRGYHRGNTSSASDLVVGGGNRSKISDDPDGFATAIHELGHHLEHVDPRIRGLEWAFFQRRTREPGYGPQEPDKRFPSGMGYGRSETFRRDGFVDAYMGKTYGNGAASSYEILTMGLESLWTGSHDLDPEMRRFILGLLAAL